MKVHQEVIKTQGKGLIDITTAVAKVVARSGVRTGLCNVFIHHTSCSLLIQENDDPSARADLETWMAQLAPEDNPAYTHTAEGPDDMAAHLRAAVTRTAEQIPVVEAKLGLGTWQGILVFEHRRNTPTRRLTVTVMGQQ